MAKQQVRKKTTTPTESPATEPVAAQTAAADTPRARRTRATPSGAAATADAPVEAGAPTFEQIAERAYLRFVERGCTPGHEVEDWLAAENELKTIVR